MTLLVISLYPSQQEEYLRRTLDYSEDSTQPVSANSSVCEGPSSPVQVEHPMEVEATHSQEVESLKRLLQEVRTARPGSGPIRPRTNIS